MFAADRILQSTIFCQLATLNGLRMWLANSRFTAYSTPTTHLRALDLQVRNHNHRRNNIHMVCSPTSCYQQQQREQRQQATDVTQRCRIKGLDSRRRSKLQQKTQSERPQRESSVCLSGTKELLTACLQQHSSLTQLTATTATAATTKTSCVVSQNLLALISRAHSICSCSCSSSCGSSSSSSGSHF